jgi:hypothetical protein
MAFHICIFHSVIHPELGRVSALVISIVICHQGDFALKTEAVHSSEMLVTYKTTCCHSTEYHVQHTFMWFEGIRFISDPGMTNDYWHWRCTFFSPCRQISVTQHFGLFITCLTCIQEVYWHTTNYPNWSFLWFCSLISRVCLNSKFKQAMINVLEKHTVTVFRAEGGDCVSLLVSAYKSTWRYKPEEQQHQHLHRCENLKSHRSWPLSLIPYTVIISSDAI